MKVIKKSLVLLLVLFTPQNAYSQVFVVKAKEHCTSPNSKKFARGSITLDEGCYKVELTGSNATMLNDKDKGHLVLRNVYLFYPNQALSCDWYYALRFGGKKKTIVVSKSKNPSWNKVYGFVLDTDCSDNSGEAKVQFKKTKCHLIELFNIGCRPRMGAVGKLQLKEVVENLTYIIKSLRKYFLSDRWDHKGYLIAKVFPKGSTKWTPRAACFRQKGKVCLSTKKTWNKPPWLQLKFSIVGQHYFQYRFVGKNFLNKRGLCCDHLYLLEARTILNRQGKQKLYRVIGRIDKNTGDVITTGIQRIK